MVDFSKSRSKYTHRVLFVKDLAHVNYHNITNRIYHAIAYLDPQPIFITALRKENAIFHEEIRFV